MIVCLCQSISESRIHAAIEQGLDTLESLQMELGIAMCCGKCTETVCDILSEKENCFKAFSFDEKEEAQLKPIVFYPRVAA